MTTTLIRAIAAPGQCPGPISYRDGAPPAVGDIVTLDDGRRITVEQVDHDPEWDIAPTVIRWHDHDGQGWSINPRSPKVLSVVSPLIAGTP